MDNIHTFGKIFNCTRAARQLILRMNRDREEVLAKVKAMPDTAKVKVFIEHSPGLYTAGRGTFMHEIITLAGGVNIAGSINGWGRLTEEEVLHAQPDVILYTAGGRQGKQLKDLILARKAWKNIPALQKGRIYEVDRDIISRPGPRLTKGLHLVAGVLYPELFEEGPEFRSQESVVNNNESE
jgi:iron complex transport system substrate-binding protein